jgi:DNA topoisomerase I
MTIRASLEAAGIRRSGGPRNGFRYRKADGRPASDADIRRIAALKIPPQWTDVSIATSPRAAVQAVGRDAAGRWQYLYSRAHASRGRGDKFRRLAAFAGAVPALRQALLRDLRLPGLPRDKALACAVAILAGSAMRAGSEEYAEANGSFGLATLRRGHVAVEGDRILLDYRGKRGLRHRHELRNRRLASIVARMLKMPGPQVIQYLDEDGLARDVSRWQLNQYIKRVMGRRFSARDFRTWAGTWICAGALARRKKAARSDVSRAEAIAEAVRETALYLGNTERVCRSSYIHPGVFAAFARGVTVARTLDHPDTAIERGGAVLDRQAAAVVQLLAEGRARVKR